MSLNQSKKPSKTKTLLVFIGTIILGFILFIFPDLFFGISKINNGKIGINLMFIGVFQFITIVGLLYCSLKILRSNFGEIGLKFKNITPDLFLGLAFGMLWSILQFGLIIPNTGGASRGDIGYMLNMYDGTALGLISFLVLGVLGGGITEELFNRGYFISVLQSVFNNKKLGLYFSASLSILFFSLGHLPSNLLEWVDILIPTLIYTILFIKTKRLTASIAAHSIYNFTAILLTYFLYF